MMQNDKPHLPSTAIGMLKRHGIVSTVLGATALLGSVLLIVFDQNGALTALGISAVALQCLAFVALFLPAFAALRGEIKQGTIEVDPEHEREMRVSMPRWLVITSVGFAAAYIGALFFTDMDANVGMLGLLALAFLNLGGNDWPSFETPAQRARGAASLGMTGFLLTMPSAMLAGEHLGRTGFVELSVGAATLIALGLTLVPGLFVFFSTIAVIGRAQHAH
ncbi:MAG: hypothetical protein AAFN17_08330 [Pseudomonadota bacterium]